MTRLLATTLVTILLCSLSVSMALSFQGVKGDLLVGVPGNDLRRATEIIVSPLEVYCRLPDLAVAGTTPDGVRQLHRAGIEVVILDEHPWTQDYAVISRHPNQTYPFNIEQYVKVLYWSGDLAFVKGPTMSFDLLRRAGISCVPVEKVPVNPLPETTRLPELSRTVTDTVADIIDLVSEVSCSTYVQGMQNFQTRVWSRTNRDTVFSWVYHRFLELGIADVRLDSFQYGGTWQKNVVATIPGTVHPESEIIVGGHLDSQNFSNPGAAPGADDNASGTMAAIEMARVLMEVGYQPTYTLRFIGFAAEEAGLIGSDHYAEEARQQNHDIKAMLNYDMIGYRNQGSSDRDVAIVWYPGSEAYSDLHALAMETYTTLYPLFTSSYRSGSDSWEFYQRGYHTVFCIEWDFNPYYHTQNDLLQYIDVPYAGDIVRSGLATLLVLDQLPATVAGMRTRDNGDGESLFVEWDASTDLDIVGYNVYIGTAPGVYDASYYQTGLTRVLGGLTEGTQYYVGVSAVDLTGLEGIILEQTAVPRTIPLPPLGLTPGPVPEGLQLTWRSNLEMDLEEYRVYRSPDTTGGFVLMDAILAPDTVWVDTLDFTVVQYYYVTAVDASGNESVPSDTVVASPTTGIGEDPSDLPVVFALAQNYPNPFNSTTAVSYQLSATSDMSLKVYDLLGREIALLAEGRKPAGHYVAYWNAHDASSGVYYYVLKADGMVLTGRAVLIK